MGAAGARCGGNCTGGVCVNALCAAAFGGDEIVLLLLEQGVDVNAKGGEYGNALQAASSEREKENVGLLLEWGAVVNAQGGNSMGMLLVRRSWRDRPTASGAGGRRECTSGCFRNTTQATSFEGHNAILWLLLELGAGMDAQGGRFGNALQS